jgi:CBS domain-containing membrane protein
LNYFEDPAGTGMKASSLFQLLGVDASPVSHTERIVSGVGGFVAIFAIVYLSQLLLGIEHPGLLVASMGASAVLLFAVPHGPLSQPWNVFGGHLVSAIVGVTCAKLVGNPFVAAAAAVGIAISAMYYLRCIHPPGGATALSAVVADDAVRLLGYQFVLTPVLMDVAIILLVAIAFNFLFHWRRYPAYLQKRKRVPSVTGTEKPVISHADFVYALSQIDSFIDINEEDLLRIYDLATQRHKAQHLSVEEIELGGIYSNGGFGSDWSVRQIVDESDDSVIYKVVAGDDLRNSGVMKRGEFAAWARYRVSRGGETREPDPGASE